MHKESHDNFASGMKKNVCVCVYLCEYIGVWERKDYIIS